MTYKLFHFICPFECGKCGKEGKKLQKFEYQENKYICLFLCHYLDV